MTRLGYVNYTNLDAGFMRPYEQGHRLVRGFSGEIDIPDRRVGVDELHAAAEAVFARHNRDDRPDGRLCPSMSVGDVVVFGEVALSVAAVGFEQVHLGPGDLITDRTWRQVTADDQFRQTVATRLEEWANPTARPDRSRGRRDRAVSDGPFLPGLLDATCPSGVAGGARGAGWGLCRRGGGPGR